MEKVTVIKPRDFEHGYFIEMECCMCNDEAMVGARTQKELSKKLKELGWWDLESDEGQVSGHYCGCEYLPL